jgi:hypothetical protein
VVNGPTAGWDDLLDDHVGTYSDRLQEISSTQELWSVVRAWDKYNKDRRRKKVWGGFVGARVGVWTVRVWPAVAGSNPLSLSHTHVYQRRS